MSALFSFSSYLCFLVVLALCHSCISNQRLLCIEGERQALLQFKHGLIDKADRLASWVGDRNSNCCRWTGIVCDNITGRVHEIHLDGSSPDIYWSCEPTRQLGGNLSSSLLNLKQLRHLDLSCNDFGGIQVPEFIGSFGNLRYLNLSSSQFSGVIPPQLGNLSKLHVLSLGTFNERLRESTRIINMQWLSSLRLLHRLYLSTVDLSKAINWFQVINTLPSLTELDLSYCNLVDAHPHVTSFNTTSLSLLDLSYNNFNSSAPQWMFSISSLISLDLSGCYFHSLVHDSIGSFHNLTSLKLLHVSRNNFMNSSLVLRGLSSSNLVSLDLGSCGVSSSVLNSIHNLTSLLTLDLRGNKLTNKIPKSFGNFCNMREIDLSENDFRNTRLDILLESFIECESSSSLEKLYLSDSHISGPIPHWIGRLSSLENLIVSDNRLNGNLPDSLGNLSKLESLTFSNNLLTGVVTEAHFAKLGSLNYLDGEGNNLTLRPQLANWTPPFQLVELKLSYWNLGPQFPLWLQSQTHLTALYLRKTGISSAMPVSFWKSFPDLWRLNLSHNHIKGTLLDMPATIDVLHLNSNEFSGELPLLTNESNLWTWDLSGNFFVGSVQRFLCSKNIKKYPEFVFGNALSLGNNHLSGVIPECWDKWEDLRYLNLENNRFSGEIPRALGSLLSLKSLNMRGNKLSGRVPASLRNLKSLKTLQLARNELVGSIPSWFGNFSSLRILNLRSNSFDGNIPHELCYLSHIQILDLAHNHLSGNIPRCFNNFSVLSGKEVLLDDQFFFLGVDTIEISGSDSLVMKGREDTYSTILGLVTLLDLSNNNLVGHIPNELTTLHALKSLNLSRNQLTGRIPGKIGDMKSLQTLDLSLNKLSGELPTSLSSLNFLLSFNVSFNFLTGRVPKSTQLQSFNKSCFFGNKLCGDPLTEPCTLIEVPNEEVQKGDDTSDITDWGLITSIVLGLIVGFWLIVAPLIVSRAWRIVYFSFLSAMLCLQGCIPEDYPTLNMLMVKAEGS